MVFTEYIALLLRSHHIVTIVIVVLLTMFLKLALRNNPIALRLISTLHKDYPPIRLTRFNPMRIVKERVWILTSGIGGRMPC